MNTKPLNNNAVVEIIKEHEGVARAGTGESPNRGYLRDVSMNPLHLTASAGLEYGKYINDMAIHWSSIIGKIVRWEEYADSGQKFTENGKEYALIPWWRITAVEAHDESETDKEEA